MAVSVALVSYSVSHFEEESAAIDSEALGLGGRRMNVCPKLLQHLLKIIISNHVYKSDSVNETCLQFHSCTVCNRANPQ